MDSPKFSIVTVSFNTYDIIEATIRSVIGQDYRNIEYIIIDGGSTDNTQEIIEQYREHISYFVSEPDGGIFFRIVSVLDIFFPTDRKLKHRHSTILNENVR